MPSVDHTGRFQARAVATDRYGRGALSFPIKASRQSTARRFAERFVLDNLPGWTAGVMVLLKDGSKVDSWILRRGVTS